MLKGKVAKYRENDIISPYEFNGYATEVSENGNIIFYIPFGAGNMAKNLSETEARYINDGLNIEKDGGMNHQSKESLSSNYIVIMAGEIEVENESE
jgi:hypothetical protein